MCLQFLVFLPTTASASWTRAEDPAKREREAEEKANPETRQRRMEDESFRRMNFFAGHTRATVSAGADTVNTPGDMQESRAPAGVKEDLPPYRHREENRLYLH